MILKMVTDLQFYRAVRSYSYRSNLIESLNKLEQKIIDYMNDKNLTKASLPGYLVFVANNEVIVKEIALPNINQLSFEFYEDAKI